MQDGKVAGMRARDGLEPLNPFELAFKRARVIETAPINDLHRTKLAQDIAAQPHFSVGPTADAADQFVIRNRTCQLFPRTTRSVAACRRDDRSLGGKPRLCPVVAHPST